MFNSLKGSLTYKSSDRVFMTLGGIEWDIEISRQTYEGLPGEGQEVRLFTYLLHKDDKMKLYGFLSDSERSLFFDLIKVESIGPALALKILSGMKAEDFITALEAEDVAALTTVPGLGKKTAQKIIFKLRGKLTKAEKKEDPLFNDIVSALTGMGFDAKKAREAVTEGLKQVDRSAFSKSELEKELIKSGIKYLTAK